jgi:hypothetical protein
MISLHFLSLEKIENGIEVLGNENFRNKVELVEIYKKIAR